MVDRLIPLSEAARLLGVSAKTVGRWIDAGCLPGFRTEGGPTGAGHRRVRRDDVLAAQRTLYEQRTAEGL